MDLETILDAAGVSVFIVVILVVVVAAVFYMIVKKKKDYHTNGVPKMKEDPKEKEGSSKRN